MAEQTGRKTDLELGAVPQTGEPLVPIVETQDLSFLSFCETKFLQASGIGERRGTVCRKSAHTDLWGAAQ